MGICSYGMQESVKPAPLGGGKDPTLGFALLPSLAPSVAVICTLISCTMAFR